MIEVTATVLLTLLNISTSFTPGEMCLSDYSVIISPNLLIPQ